MSQCTRVCAWPDVDHQNSKSSVESSISSTLDKANTFILVAHITVGLGGLLSTLGGCLVVFISFEFCKLKRLLDLLQKHVEDNRTEVIKYCHLPIQYVLKCPDIKTFLLLQFSDLCVCIFVTYMDSLHHLCFREKNAIAITDQ